MKHYVKLRIFGDITEYMTIPPEIHDVKMFLFVNYFETLDGGKASNKGSWKTRVQRKVFKN